jgi:hypothetical protein
MLVETVLRLVVLVALLQAVMLIIPAVLAAQIEARAAVARLATQQMAGLVKRVVFLVSPLPVPVVGEQAYTAT